MSAGSDSEGGGGRSAEPSRHWLTDRPVANLVVFLALVVFGFFSLRQLPVELMPELTYPTLTVRTEYPGTAPQEVENEVSRPLEEALGVVPGLSRIKSISRSGVSDVVLEFVWGTNMDNATQEVLEKMDRVFLPNEAESPLILHFDPSLDPIMELSLSGRGDRFAGEAGLRRLRRIGELQVKRDLERIEGVAAVRVRGGLEEEFHVLLDHEKLERSQLSIEQVIQRLRQENINMPGGLIKEGRSEYMIRALNEFENIDQIAETVLLRDGNREVRVADVGQVIRTHKEKELITRTDGRESVQIDIYKEADANIVEVARKVRERLGDEKALEPGGSEGKPSKPGGFGKKGGFAARTGLTGTLFQNESAILRVTADRSEFIKGSINEVRNTALIGGGLAILVLMVFLRDLRSTAIIGVSIPLSLFMTFAPMNLSGVSLNIMSLGGLAMGIGMLVDSSIVVLESIFRCREEGDSMRAAAIRGSREVRGAVVASTLTSVAVFFPMVFVEGLAGQAFFDLGLAVVFSLTASLLVAVFFIPMLASRGGFAIDRSAASGEFQFATCQSWTVFRESLGTHTGLRRALLMPYFVIRLVTGFLLELVGKILAGVLFLVISVVLLAGRVVHRIGALVFHGPLWLCSRILDGVAGLYRRILAGLPALSFWVIPVVIVSFWGLFMMGSRLDSELLPEIHQSEITFEVSLPIGTPIELTEQVLSGVEEAILSEKDQIESLIFAVGYDVTNMQRSDEGEHSAKFKLLLTPSRTPARTEEAVIARVRSVLQTVPDADFRVVRPVLFSSQTPIEVEIAGDNLEQLKSISDRSAEILRQLPELRDVEPMLKKGAPEIQIIYDRDQVVRFGLDLQSVASQVKAMVQGTESTKFNLKDRRIPIVVRLEESDRTHTEDIRNLSVFSSAGEPVRLSALADVISGTGPSEIRRIDGSRTAVIQANLGAASLSEAADAIRQALEEQIEWPVGMTFQITGQNQEWKESQGSLYLALALSLFLVYVIMAAQFESLVQPLLIMLTIPLAFLGTFIGLLWLQIPISVVVILGMIMLAGIVVNNAIVLVDYSNQLRDRGMDLQDAVATAASVRFRPILMTTMTTLLGLVPMAIASGNGAEIRTPMAFAVMTGLVSSTVLTLIVIPGLYYLMARVMLFFKPSAQAAGTASVSPVPGR
jgi:HAE1 family hydrophobic/amphiphilic exporter-1